MTRHLPCEEIIQNFTRSSLIIALSLPPQQLSCHGSSPKVLAALDREQTQKKQLTLPTPTITDRLEANPMHVWKQVERAEDVGTKDLHTQDFSVSELCHNAIAHSYRTCAPHHVGSRRLVIMAGGK